MSSGAKPRRTIRRRELLKYSALAAGVLAVTPLAAACGTQAPAATPTTSASNLAKDQIFHFNILGEPNLLDPTLAEDTNTDAVSFQMFDMLVKYKPDLSVEANVAESWTVSLDGKTYTFKLKDTKWSDGKAVTAKDFEYSFKRLADPKVASPYAGFVYEIAGVEAYNTALGTSDKPLNPSDADLQKLRDAVGAKAIDDKTFQVTLVNPASYILSLLTQINMAPLRQDIVEKYGDKWTDADKIVVNGPFILQEWSPKSKITLKPNANYAGTKPTLTSIQITFITEDATAFASYQNNELDVSATIPDAQIPQIRTDPTLSKEIVQTPQLATYYLGFNVTVKPFDDKRVRQAFQMAVDTKTLCTNVLNGVPSPAKSFIPPGMPGHQPDIGFDFNADKAKQLLADAGYPGGAGFPKVTLVYNTSTGHKLRVEYVQAQLKTSLGIDIAVENWDSQTYFRKVATEHPPFYRVGWNADYPHPNDFLKIVFGTGQAQNYGLYSNTQADALNDQAAAEPDQAKAVALYNQSQKLLVDDAPAVWLYWYGVFRLVKPWVKNFTTTAKDSYLGCYFWRYIQIAAH